MSGYDKMNNPDYATGFLPQPVAEEPVLEGPDGRIANRQYEKVLRPLMATPGQWYKIKYGQLTSLRATASNLKLRKCWVPEGVWEFKATRDPDHPDSTVKGCLYVKYVGPEAAEDPVSQEHPLAELTDKY